MLAGSVFGNSSDLLAEDRADGRGAVAARGRTGALSAGHNKVRCSCVTPVDGPGERLVAMATFVIVHGGFGGGWEWTPVALKLRVQGHVVFTPTLTGMGERVHLGPDVGLATHVEDVVAMLEFEDLDEVILCGASYGGMPVTGAADRVADRIRLIAYVDALVPADGQSALDLLPRGVRRHGASRGRRSRSRVGVNPARLAAAGGAHP